ncbi:MAG: type II toxin-antitoxin system mRNA interferase toxin, RelE/StbE family [Anaerolineae bacterium]|nr:type II toxin-antitoxin system mRNA interferase toxin, RelE/StbE family [Anaerolineae bacterium]
MYTITYSRQFEDQLKKLKGRPKSDIEQGIQKHLRDQPDVESEKRKRLRDNSIADWELRLKPRWRILYNVYTDVVEVVVVVLGEKKRNKLFIDGEEVEL